MYTHSHAFSLPGASDVRSHTSPWWSMSVSLCFCVRISMSTLFCCRGTLEGWRRVGGRAGRWWRRAGVDVRWGGASPGCPPCVYLGRVAPPKALPLSVAGTDQGLITPHLSWERNIPQRPNRGAAATPPTEWAHCGDGGWLAWPGLARPAPERWSALWSDHSLNDAFKESRASAQWWDSKSNVEKKLWLAWLKKRGKDFAGVVYANTSWDWVFSLSVGWMLLPLCII